VAGGGVPTPVPHVAPQLLGAAAEGGQPHPLVSQLGSDQPPTLVDLADHIGAGNPHLLVVGRVGVGQPGGGDGRALVAGGGGRDDDDRDTVVLGRLRVGPAGQPDV